MTPVGASFSQVPGEHEGPTQQLALAPIPMEGRSMKKSILYFIAVATLFMCSGCSQEGASASSAPSWKDGLEVVRQDTVVVANLEHGELVCERTDRLNKEDGRYYSDIEIRSKEGDYKRHIAHATRFAPIEGTIQIGLQGVDLNGDGSEDLIMDIGASGKLLPSYAFVYDIGSDCFVPICGYSLLGFPSLHFGADGRPMIIEDCITNWLDDSRDYDSAWNKYLVSGRQLELVETVKLKYFGDTGGYFTETKLVNGEWKVTRSNVKEGDFDLEAWKDTYPGQ